jgi:aspartate kinase
MKFGGAAVATPEQFSQIADIIIHRSKEYEHIVIVVSAMGDTTDDLIALAKRVNPDPPRREYDMLITVGERISISLLAMALAGKKKEAISFTGSQCGIITCDRHTDARIVDVRPHRLLPHLDLGRIAIVAGFQGVSRNGEITTLGRGGSDTTAVALGVALNAEKVEFFKDVDGIYDEDPKKDPFAMHRPYLSYQDALGIIKRGAQVLQERCIHLASKNELPLQIRSFHNYNSEGHPGTLIGSSSLKNIKEPIYEEVVY